MKTRRYIPVCGPALLALCALAAGSQTPKNPAPRADANALCSFITIKMQSALPQVPTLCAPVTDTSGDPYALPSTLIVSVFSPTDVLEGRMRRAWSTGLFQTFQALLFGGALNGACESTRSEEIPGEIPACELRVSDSILSQSRLYYRVSLTGAQGRLMALAGDPASESTYEHWWEVLEAGETGSYPGRGSKGNAELIAQDACKEFQKAFPESLPFQARPAVGPGPGCAVMLATDTSIYVVLDFSNPLDARSLDISFPLLEVFGRRFDHTGYDGAVIFRTAWFGSDDRLYEMYPLRDIEFWWEEDHAGVREKGGAAAMLLFSRESGQEDRHAFSGASGKAATLRMPAVVSVTPVPGSDFVLVDLTDGSEWSFPAKASPGCGLTPGTTLTEVGGGKTSPQAWLGARNECARGTFVQGW